MYKKLIDDFYEIFQNNKCPHLFFAPGRVNLIGEHTDYNGGNVFPCAINYGTYALVTKRKDSLIRLYSKNFKKIGIIEFDLKTLDYNQNHNWANYPKGVVVKFIEASYKIDSGFDILYYGNIPNGAGLSSSASLELVTSVAIKNLFDLNIIQLDMVKISQKAENEFVGVNCGIMDQFAIGMGKENHAILLSCNTLKYRYCKFDFKDVSLIIANTNKRRGLADSKYNERRLECERALIELKKKLDIQYLGDLTEEDFEKNKDLIKNDIDRKRAKHAVYENRRTIKAVKALEDGDLKEFGRLMKASHISLRDDYEVTGLELDTLAECAWYQEGTIGTRMTGAGFGGCTINIVKKDKVEEFIQNVGSLYNDKIGYKADFYVVTIGDGAKEIKFSD